MHKPEPWKLALILLLGAGALSQLTACATAGADARPLRDSRISDRPADRPGRF